MQHIFARFQLLSYILSPQCQIARYAHAQLVQILQRFDVSDIDVGDI